MADPDSLQPEASLSASKRQVRVEAGAEEEEGGTGSSHPQGGTALAAAQGEEDKVGTEASAEEGAKDLTRKGTSHVASSGEDTEEDIEARIMEKVRQEIQVLIAWKSSKLASAMSNVARSLRTDLDGLASKVDAQQGALQRAKRSLRKELEAGLARVGSAPPRPGTEVTEELPAPDVQDDSKEKEQPEESRPDSVGSQLSERSLDPVESLQDQLRSCNEELEGVRKELAELQDWRRRHEQDLEAHTARNATEDISIEEELEVVRGARAEALALKSHTGVIKEVLEVQAECLANHDADIRDLKEALSYGAGSARNRDKQQLLANGSGSAAQEQQRRPAELQVYQDRAEWLVRDALAWKAALPRGQAMDSPPFDINLPGVGPVQGLFLRFYPCGGVHASTQDICSLYLVHPYDMPWCKYELAVGSCVQGPYDPIFGGSDDFCSLSASLQEDENGQPALCLGVRFLPVQLGSVSPGSQGSLQSPLGEQELSPSGNGAADVNISSRPGSGGLKPRPPSYEAGNRSRHLDRLRASTVRLQQA